MSDQAPVLLTIAETMVRLNIKNRQTLANWRSEGTGPPWTKIAGEVGSPGGQVRYPQDELNAYIEARTVRPGLDAGLEGDLAAELDDAPAA